MGTTVLTLGGQHVPYRQDFRGYQNRNGMQQQRPVTARVDDSGGRYWDRTSGPCRVKAVLYR
jgi:hypothetical protein